MQITEITVSAGRTFNHPYEQYSNLKPYVTMKAVLSEGEDAAAATKELQKKCEELVEDHKRNMLQSLEELRELSQRQQEMASLSAQLGRAQARLEEIRKEHPELAALPAAVEPAPSKVTTGAKAHDCRKCGSPCTCLNPRRCKGCDLHDDDEKEDEPF